MSSQIYTASLDWVGTAGATDVVFEMLGNAAVRVDIRRIVLSSGTGASVVKLKVSAAATTGGTPVAITGLNYDIGAQAHRATLRTFSAAPTESASPVAIRTMPVVSSTVPNIENGHVWQPGAELHLKGATQAFTVVQVVASIVMTGFIEWSESY